MESSKGAILVLPIFAPISQDFLIKYTESRTVENDAKVAAFSELYRKYVESSKDVISVG